MDGDGRGEELRAAAEPLEGGSIRWARSLARELGIDLVAGSLVELVEGREKLANTSVHIDASGEIRAVYRKIHMFDVEIGGRRYSESAIEDAGEEIVISASAEGVPLGLSICYDLRFPELYRILALRGARVIVVPAAFTLSTTRDHWEVLLRARAIENQAFVVAANQVGKHPAGTARGEVDDRGPVGGGARDGGGRRGAHRRRPRPALASRRSARGFPRSPTAARRLPLAGARGGAHGVLAMSARSRGRTSGG